MKLIIGIVIGLAAWPLLLLVLAALEMNRRNRFRRLKLDKERRDFLSIKR